MKKKIKILTHKSFEKCNYYNFLFHEHNHFRYQFKLYSKLSLKQKVKNFFNGSFQVSSIQP